MFGAYYKTPYICTRFLYKKIYFIDLKGFFQLVLLLRS